VPGGFGEGFVESFCGMKAPLAGFPVGGFAGGGATSDRGIGPYVGAGGGVRAGAASASAAGF
jgi:hypothetical protein